MLDQKLTSLAADTLHLRANMKLLVGTAGNKLKALNLLVTLLVVILKAQATWEKEINLNTLKLSTYKSYKGYD